ncbi:pilus assembly protein PilM [Candidatus Pelagibacter sp.]|jgi:type IV pilus assembly protein PilN|nr:pilus assembly protein PilM [Candidatus Pelagibacter sp.]|tara:strand:+ start:2158 stop:3852 length:1695 start_codon:yes stop_codon:yes gene_type:complete
MKNFFSNLFKKKFENQNLTSSSTNTNKSSWFEKFFKKRLGNKAKGEDVVGVEISGGEIRLAQISQANSGKWNLNKFYIHKIVGLPDEANITDHADLVSAQLKVAVEKSKISTSNAAVAIPVTSAIIRVVTSPLMTDEELDTAIKSDSLWENLVQLTDNLSDYSIFHQVVNRNQTANTMDILFVASKLSDVNVYTSIIENGGLNPVIIDVKCFSLKSAVDQINQISSGLEEENLTVLLEFGLDENYVMILYDNNPIITDIFIRGQDRQILLNSDNPEDIEALIRRYVTQVKQAIQDFETKYEKRVRNIRVISNLDKIDIYLESFRKNLTNTGFVLFDPIKDLNVQEQLKQNVEQSNRSYFASVIGLAFRKLDVFGYYKFVTAVKNINLLPNRDALISEKKAQIFSNFAFKGVISIVAVVYIVLFSFSFWQISNLNKKIVNYEKIVKEHKSTEKEKNKFAKELGRMTTSLKLSKSIKSNKVISFKVLAQVASSVPRGLRFESIEYDGQKRLIITGSSANDQNILKLIRNLNDKKSIRQATLATMSSVKSPNGQENKGFKIICRLEA